MWTRLFRKFIIAILFLTLFQYTQAQDLRGIWISSYGMNIQKRIETSDFQEGEIVRIPLPEMEIDTFYNNAYSLLHFTSVDQAIFQPIGGEKITGTYTAESDTVNFISDEHQLKILQKGEYLILLDLDSGWQNTHIFFERMYPKANLSESLEEIIQKDTYWLIQADTNSINNGLELHFLDSGRVMIGEYNDWRNTTSYGEFKLASYENSVFLYIVDRHSLDDKIFRIYGKSRNHLYATTYEDIWGEEPPEKHNLQIEESSLPSRNGLNNIQENIIGSWELDSTSSIPVDSILSDYKVLQEAFFSFRLFEDHTYTMRYGGFYTNEGQGQFLTKDLQGIWALGPTGKYIEMHEEDGYLKYISFSDLMINHLGISLDLQSVTVPNFNYGNYSIKLRRVK